MTTLMVINLNLANEDTIEYCVGTPDESDSVNVTAPSTWLGFRIIRIL